MTSRSLKLPTGSWAMGYFIVLQVGIMLLAISHESFWIDEFWNAYVASLDSLGQLYELLVQPYGSQTPLHFAYCYMWGQLFPLSESSLRLTNLPLFALGQACMFWALRAYPKPFGYLLLALSALHPMVWQYANEARPYIMIYSGSEMILAYILHIHATDESDSRVSLPSSVIFVTGSILLFGASLLGVFWVTVACVYVAYFHYRKSGFRYLKRRSTLLLVSIFIAINGLLTLYYMSSLLRGGGASRIASTTVTTLLFDAYELLGLSGIGPGRLELRETGLASLSPYWIWLIPVCILILVVLAKGLQEAKRLLGIRLLILVGALGVVPVAIVVFSGFAMHWRVLGRHLIATLPLLNLLIALGLAKLCERESGRVWPVRSAIAGSFLLVFVCSSFSLRFADRHRKDDYRAAVTLAKHELADGKRIWWAADALGARYYGLPGEFDYIGELTNVHKPYACIDQSGVQPVSAASAECLDKLIPPDVVILSKPEVFDKNGALASYLRSGKFVNLQSLPAFAIWRSSAPTGTSTTKDRSVEKQ